MKEHIKHTRLTYSCGAGEATVNVRTGRLTFTHSDLSIGTENYCIGINHVYNPETLYPQGITPRMGKGWKLNVEQYVIREVGGNGENDKFKYVDSLGYIHEFEFLEKGLNGIDYGYIYTYYDKTGLGLTLTFDRTVNYPYVITDTVGNVMFFDSSGQLRETTSVHHNTIKKVYEYQSGKLVKIYDNRKSNHKIILSYDSSGRLSSMKSTHDNESTPSITYFYRYDSFGNLIEISKIAEGLTEPIAYFRYDINNNLTNAIDGKNFSSLVFEYYEKAKEGVYKVKNVLNGQYDTNKDQIGIIKVGEEIGSVLTSNDIVSKSENFYVYHEIDGVFNYTKVTNENKVVLNYYFNAKGFTTSILEVDENENDLRTLEKIPGVYMLIDGFDSEKINKQGSHLLTVDTDISTATEPTKNLIVDGVLSGMKSYRSGKCLDYVHYTCSFWLKMHDKLIVPKIFIDYNSYDGSNNHRITAQAVTFDNSAMNSWQQITIPIEFKYKNIDYIRIYFSTEDRKTLPKKTFKVADMRLCFSSVSKYHIRNVKELIPLNDITKIKYTLSQSNQEEQKDITEDLYISEFDLQMTYLSLFQNTIVKSGYKFELSCCENTKKINVTNVKFCRGNDEFPLCFGDDNYANGTRAQICHEYRSPDDKLYTYDKIHFVKNKKINTKTYNCIWQITESNRVISSSESKQSNKQVYADLLGKVLLEQDEYNVQAIYDYDIYGNLISKIIQHKDTSEKIVFTASFNDNYTNTIDYKSDVKKYCNEHYGVIEKVEYNGKNEDMNNKLIETFGYNTFNDKLISIENNLGGKNHLQYENKNGRLLQVTPISFTSSDTYGFKFGYNLFGDPCEYYLISKVNNNSYQDLLVKKDIDYKNSTITTYQYRDINAVDTSIVTLDKYDRTDSIVEKVNGKDKETTFTRKYLWESSGACKVETMYDPFEDRTYIYSYDDFNNATGYEIRSGDRNGKFLGCVNSSGVSKTAYCANTVAYDSEIIFQGDKFINPRIDKTIDGAEIITGDNSMKKEYGYDCLGRIIQKTSRATDFVNIMTVNEEITYKSGTLLKETIKTKLDNSIDLDIEHRYKNYYDERGNLITKQLEVKKTGVFTSDTIYKQTDCYVYDKANRLVKEYNVNDLVNPGTFGNGTITYTYNQDGSINTESVDNIKVKDYRYQKGRLIAFTYPGVTDWTEFGYDNLGNCTHYRRGQNADPNMIWERGNLLKEYTTSGPNANLLTMYYYNNQGIRFKKVYAKNTANEKTIEYFYDGSKLLGEKRDNKNIKYLYDAEGMMGFSVEYAFGKRHYNFVKDVMNNVVAIYNHNDEVARYKYDAWGNCTILKDDDGIGTLNLIRWNSQYYDDESGLYYTIGRYYSPFMKQYISSLSLETVVANVGVIYGLYRYALNLTNPIGMLYNEHNIKPSMTLAYNPGQLSKWELFWKPVGQWFSEVFGWYKSIPWYCKLGIGIVLFAAAIGLTILSGGTVIPLFIKFGIGSGRHCYRYWNKFDDG